MGNEMKHAESSAPVVMSYPNSRAPDTRLKVFKKEFHCHSNILKEHSEYFARFMDSVDKKGQQKGTREFRYEYVTKVDSDGTWALGPALDTKDPVGNQPDFKGDPEIEESAFENILMEFYNERYQVASCNDLISMVALADFYLVLPLISKSLRRASYSERFAKEIPHYVLSLLPLSVTIRHTTLFKDCFTLLVGKWDCRDYEQLEDVEYSRKLKRSFQRAHSLISTDIEKMREIIHIYPFDLPPGFRERTYEAFSSPYKLPALFHELSRFEEGEHVRHFEFWKLPLERLMKSSLSFDSAAKAGEGDVYGKYFLCAAIENEDLPWVGEVEE